MSAAADPQAIYDRLKAAWSSETSIRWIPDNPARGQCSVTALVVQDLPGGNILKTRTSGGIHFYNLIDGRKWDFTVSQFDNPIPFDDTLSNRQEAMADTTPAQYRLLKSRLMGEN